MEKKDSGASEDPNGEAEVPRLALSSLDNPADDDVFSAPHDKTARFSDVSMTTHREKSNLLKKNKSAGDIMSSLEDARSAVNNRLLKRSDSLESGVGDIVTSRPILKRSSMADLRGSQTDRPRRVSIARQMSVKAGWSEPPTPVDPNSGRRFSKKNVSFGHLPSESDMDFVGQEGLSGRRQSIRQSLERRMSGLQLPGDRRQSVVGQSPERTKGPMRRRDSMMTMLRTELIKKEKIKFDRRGRFKSNVSMPRKERSSDEILSATKKKEPPPLNKRMSMPALRNRTDSSNSLTNDNDDDDVFLSTFDRRKLTLLSSLDKMGVKLPRRAPRMSLDDEAEVLKAAAKSQRHGSLTSRTLLNNFTDRPLGKKKSQEQLQAPQQEGREISEVTKAKLQKIFDTMTKEDAKEDETELDASSKDKAQKILRFMEPKRAQVKVMTAMPGLEGRNRYSVTEDEMATSTLSVFRSRLRRRRKRSSRFKTLAKFICLLLRAWRLHANAVNAILEYVHTIDVTMDGDAKDGLLFDITEYKADTEARLSQEAIRILKKRPVERTPDEIHYVQIALWNYQSLAEYPVHMQKMIAERAWFESYGPKRVIVREGHVPMCFYFVLSGSALVSVMDLEKGVAKTIMYYNRGDSFGELAIMNRSRRQSTVISKDNMQLLVLTDTDFIEVFMSGGLKDPDDPFLNSLPYLDGWPKEKLSENPKKAVYSYFKRGTILVPDSQNNDWIIIVKSGSVSLLKKLKAVNAKKAIKQRAAKSFREKLRELAEEEEAGETTHEERVQLAHDVRQAELEKVGHLQRFYALPEISVATNEEYNELKRLHDEFTELHGTHLLHGARDLAGTHTPLPVTDQQIVSRGASNVSLDRQGTATSLDQKKLSSLVKKGPFMAKRGQDGTPSGENTAMETRDNTDLSALFRHDTMSADQEVKPTKAPPSLFVNVQTLTKGMVFGLSDLFFDNQPAMVLVSNGAECISISKKLFMEHASHAFVTRIREDIYPYPTEEDLQENLDAQICWDAHRREMMTHVVHDLIWKRADKNDCRFNLSPALGY